MPSLKQLEYRSFLKEDRKDKVIVGFNNKGKVVSQETKEKLRKAQLGKKHTEETKRKLREVNLGENSPNYKGRYINSSGYVILNINGKKITEHRFLMGLKVGYSLPSDIYVHHKNGIKDDNRLENLELVVLKTHFGKVQCPHCREEFSIK